MALFASTVFNGNQKRHLEISRGNAPGLVKSLHQELLKKRSGQKDSTCR
ncbi:22742_t:CDS:2 [Cetraspora pellucida]|uniref:22742_t:CDS:1 n=1 Tax=Cetraspora pellucida TaxID=1433469 RepID=A0A9N8VSW9_9GLOM|nr:22742_t:CDS:2 [Cetraspora pellucida]